MGQIPLTFDTRAPIFCTDWSGKLQSFAPLPVPNQSVYFNLALIHAAINLVNLKDRCNQIGQMSRRAYDHHIQMAMALPAINAEETVEDGLLPVDPEDQHLELQLEQLEQQQHGDREEENEVQENGDSEGGEWIDVNELQVQDPDVEDFIDVETVDDDVEGEGVDDVMLIEEIIVVDDVEL